MDKQAKRVSRRLFLKGLAAVGAAGAAAPYLVPASALGREGRPAPSNRIVMGCIGVGGQGSGDMRAFTGFPEVQVVAVCDVDAGTREGARQAVEGYYAAAKANGSFKGCDAYNDFREVTGRGDIDAILCATPDHWHALVTVAAMKSGKDVYCEKPESLTIREGRVMVETARRYGRVFSGGSQRVWDDYNWFHRMVRGGAIGQVQECWVNVGWPSDEMLRPAMPVPQGLDWEMWLGPAPWRPYNKDYHPFNWRGCRDFSGGGMTDWGAHGFGGALFCMGLQETGPVEVLPPNGKDPELLTFKFANGIVMHHGGGKAGILTFRGTEGEISEASLKVVPPDIDIPHYHGASSIFGDFLHCVRTRERPFRDIEIAHRTVTVCHLGNLASWLKRPLKWDPVKEEFIGDAEANRWLDRPKRAPWAL